MMIGLMIMCLALVGIFNVKNMMKLEMNFKMKFK